MINLKAKPYNLSHADIAWVESTIAGMSAEEKVGQLFWQLTAGNSEEYLQVLMEKYHLGGCRYNAMPGQMVLMIGDAPGDCDAAHKNGVHYYPILVNHEKESWDEAVLVAFEKLQNGDYVPYGKGKKQEFLANLGG